MSFLFGTPKVPEVRIPAPPTVPTAPATTLPEVAKVAEEEKKKLTKGREKRETILTSPQGVLGPAPVQLKTLLGQ